MLNKLPHPQMGKSPQSGGWGTLWFYFAFFFTAVDQADQYFVPLTAL